MQNCSFPELKCISQSVEKKSDVAGAICSCVLQRTIPAVDHVTMSISAIGSSSASTYARDSRPVTPVVAIQQAASQGVEQAVEKLLASLGTVDQYIPGERFDSKATYG